MASFPFPAPLARRAIFGLVELAILASLVIVAAALRFARYSEGALADADLWPKAVITAAIIQVCLYYGNLYEDRALERRIQLIQRLGQSLIATAIVLSVLYYVVPWLRLERGILLLLIPMTIPVIVAFHFVLRPWVEDRDALSKNVLILGSGITAQSIAIEMLRPSIGFRVAGFLGEHPAEVGRRLVNPSIVGTVQDLLPLVDQHKIELIVVALEDRRGKLPVDDLLKCRMAGVRVEEATTFYERLTGKIQVTNLRPSWLVFSSGFNKSRQLRTAKAIIEGGVALVSLALISPLLLCVAAILKLDSRGPVLYKQERTGEGGRPFGVFKLRTMRVDAEAGTGPVWATADGDPRITRIGRLLRKTRLDELPQLINVLRGEMSFVGPRPERPHFVQELSKVIPYYDQRHSVKPGITGWAQIRYRYGSTIEDAEEKLQYDIYYVKHMSPLFDIAIILETVKVMLHGSGAR